MGADVLYMGPVLAAPIALGPARTTTCRMVELLQVLESVGCLDISPRRLHGGTDLGAVDAAARRLVASLPWAAIRSVRLECDRVEETVALLRLIPALAPVIGMHVLSCSLPRLGAVLEAIRGPPGQPRPADEVRAMLARVARVHVDDGSWGVHAVHNVVDAMPAIAALPPGCAVSFSAALCRNAMAVPLLRCVLSPDGGRRARVDVVCACIGVHSAFVFASAPSCCCGGRSHEHEHEPPLCPFVQAVAACVKGDGEGGPPLRAIDANGRALGHQPDGDLEAALRRLRGHRDGAAFVTLCAFSLGARAGSPPGDADPEQKSIL